MDKQFIGITRVITFKNGGTIIKQGFKLEDLEKVAKKGWVNLIVSKKKEPNNDGKDYYTCVDTYEPKK